MQENFSDTNTENTASPVVKTRKAYSAPVLTTYGSVTALTQGGSGTNNEGPGSTKTSRKPSSDVRLKQNINRIGQHPLGFGIYLFDYKPSYRDAYGHGRRFGVMAQEVELLVPAAISENSEGFKVVDYEMLGIQPALH